MNETKIMALMLAASFGAMLCGLYLLEPPKTTIEWSSEITEPFQIERGFRSDGVMMWRKVDPKPAP